MSRKEFSIEKMQRAFRIRQIRENAGLTQNAFAEFLEISVDGYVKIERGENNISLAILEKMQDKMSVSADYLLYGQTQSADEIWKDILTCTEEDKLLLMLRLFGYFAKTKTGIFPLKEEALKTDEKIIEILKKLQYDEK